MSNLSKTEKLLAQKESARLYLIGLVNPTDEELEEWGKGWDIDHSKQSEKSGRVTIDLGKMESEQDEDLTDKYLEASRSIKIPQSVLNREAAEQAVLDAKRESLKNSSKTEKPLTQKEADRLSFIGLMNPSDEDLKYWDSTYDESMKEDVKEAMNMGQTEWEQEMSLEDALLEGAREAKRPQDQIDFEVEN